MLEERLGRAAEIVENLPQKRNPEDDNQLVSSSDEGPILANVGTRDPGVLILQVFRETGILLRSDYEKANGACDYHA